jgi:hypothetical protein
VGAPKVDFEPARFDSDPLYARAVGNLNVLTYIINHLDSNTGNILVSTIPGKSRLYSIDNGIAFSSARSDRGASWSVMRAKRLPGELVDRLRGMSVEALERQLLTVAELEMKDGRLVWQEPGEKFGPNAGVRRRGDRIQLGLTTAEIRAVHRKAQALLKQVDGGKIQRL